MHNLLYSEFHNTKCSFVINDQKLGTWMGEQTIDRHASFIGPKRKLPSLAHFDFTSTPLQKQFLINSLEHDEFSFTTTRRVLVRT